LDWRGLIEDVPFTIHHSPFAIRRRGAKAGCILSLAMVNPGVNRSFSEP
jgi:hypothetical protein